MRQIVTGAALLLLVGVAGSGRTAAAPSASSAVSRQGQPQMVFVQASRPYGSYEGGRRAYRVVHTGVVRDLDRDTGTFLLRVSRTESYIVHVSGRTRVLSRGRSASWGDVREGGQVRVEGILTRNGIIEARTLEGFGR